MRINPINNILYSFKSKKEEKSYIDKFDNSSVTIIGYDGGDISRVIRESLREDLTKFLIYESLSKDCVCLSKQEKKEEINENQLAKSSKYKILGEARTNKQGQKVHVCTNLLDMPDMNGLRGKTPLSGKAKEVNWRLGEVKKSGIKRIIDLRSEGEVSKAALNSIKKLELEYFNFPVEDENWSKESLQKITELINVINKGDFYIGCANGESRTNLAVALNYLLNPTSEEMPILPFVNLQSTKALIRINTSQIMKLIIKNKDIVKEWGWKDFETFIDSYSYRYGKMSEINSYNGKKNG